MNANEREIMEMALLGFDQQMADIRNKKFEIEVRLGNIDSSESIKSIKPTLVKVHKKRKVSAAGRKAIAAGQKARWANVKKQRAA